MHRVFVDSNVLGSKTQYDWVFMLRHACSMFAVYASDDVLDEAHRVWRRKHPDAGGEMRRHRETLFRENFDEVLDGWAGGTATSLTDIDDTHVHNAAAAARVDILLTNNVDDFGDPSLLPYDLYTPDEFFLLVESNNPQAVRAVTREQAMYWAARNAANPDSPRRSLAESLVAAGCPGFAAAVERHLRILTGAAVVSGGSEERVGAAEAQSGELVHE